MPQQEPLEDLSVRARRALQQPGILDLEHPDSASRLAAVPGCGPATVREIAVWTLRAGSKLGGYADGRRQPSHLPTLTTQGAARVVGTTPEYFVLLAENCGLFKEHHEGAQVWSEQDISSVRRALRHRGPEATYKNNLSRWSKFPLVRSAERGALACVASAALHLGTIARSRNVLDELEATARERASGTLTKAMDDGHLWEKAVRLFAQAAKLHVFRPNPPRLGDFIRGDDIAGVSIAFVRCGQAGLDDRDGDDRFVLVLDLVPEGVVIADPHPSADRVALVAKERFVASWEAARTKRPWAALLYRVP